jgi:2-polyprenyl-3-methyl-5-hydroxy-6-metoxy-1,4-benzoquinol methylase
MEINIEPARAPRIPELLPPSHPNYRLWANYARFARARGKLVADILESFQPVANLRILDVGFGMGGTTLALLARGARVVAVEFNPQKSLRLKSLAVAQKNGCVLAGGAEHLNFKTNRFDWVIFQDVLEHLPHPQTALAEARRVLKPGGRLYISTPNRWSLLWIADPHWNLPLVAALFSLPKLQRWLRQNHFHFRFVNRAVAQRLFVQPTAVVNSDVHLTMMALAQKLHLEKAVCTLVNERCGVFNHFINPTWYLIAQKVG